MQSYTYGYSCGELAARGKLSVSAVVLGAGSSESDDGITLIDSLTEARRLIEWGFETYEWREIIGENPIKSTAVKYASGTDSVNLRPSAPLSLLLKRSIPDSDIIKVVRVYAEERGQELTAPIKKGEELGMVVVYIDGEEIGSVILAADASIAKAYSAELRDSISSAFSSVFVKWMICVVALIIVLYIVYLIVSGLRYAKQTQIKLEAANRLAEARREREKNADLAFEKNKSGNYDEADGFGFFEESYENDNNEAYDSSPEDLHIKDAYEVNAYEDNNDV